MKIFSLRIFIFSIVLLAASGNCRAQFGDMPMAPDKPAHDPVTLGVQLSYISPAGDLKYYFKPTVGYELFIRLEEPDDRLQFSIAVGYYSHKATMDTFPIYAIQSGGSGAGLLPGKEVWSKYEVIPIGLSTEYNILDDTFSPIVGMDFYGYVAYYSHYSNIPGFMTTDETNSTTFTLAVLPKVGVLYNTETGLVLGAGIGKSYGYTIDVSGNHRYWKSYLNVSYSF